MRTFDYMAVLAMAACLPACSTLRSAPPQAENGIELVARMELEMQAFRKLELASEGMLRDSLAAVRLRTIERERTRKADELVMVAAGARRQVDIKNRIAALVAGLAENEAGDKNDILALDREMASLLAPLPSTAAASAATQAKFAELAKPLSLKVQFSELKDFKESVEATIEANRKKIDEQNKPE